MATLIEADGGVYTGTAVSSVQRRPIGRIIARRLVQVPIVLFIVSVLVFWLVQVVPGDPGRSVLGPYATDAQVALWKEQHGIVGASVEGYLTWLGAFLRGDWGISLLYNEPVRPLITAWLINSMTLGVYAFVLVVVFGIALGLFQAFHQGRRSDRGLTIGLVSLSAIPEFAVGTVLLVVFSVFLGWFPVYSGILPDTTLSDRLRAMTLPAFTLMAASVGYVARMVRAGTIETLESPFYRTAVLKGLRERQIVSNHVIRNSLVPSVAVLGGQLAYLIGGTAVVETLFSYPGIGLASVVAVQRKDIFVLEAVIMVTALASIVLLLVTDLIYMALDPRIDISSRNQQ
ncbi:MAG: ABC transporter permease [Propionibacteriaceae bacterium]|jgi:peptide/nickel transport system permease protein|nr:ABC transporter permease [Propionibacteriaceae bacterium]